jgi:hypothetical protein
MMKTYTLTLITVLLCAIVSVAFIRRDDVPLDKLVTNLQRWTDSIPQEKVYLHMDKPYYALGDTIWFKGYLTIGSRHQLSKLSGAVYVDLISEKDSVLQQLKLPVTSGMVMGNFILKDDYHQGSYRLRAYTQWMRNAGEDYFFDHTFLVGDIAGGEIVAKADFSYRDDKGKKTLTALLNYTNDQGKALGEKDLRYEIWVNHKPLWQQNGKTDALGSLRITIPDDIKQHPEGAYLHTILQGSDKYPATRDFPIKATLTQSDIQFFPESGNLVNSLTSRVGFKAVGIDGLGIHIKGRVTDNDNQEVARFETLHAGMGSFLMTPVAGKTYTANIIFDDGTTKTIPLPKPADEGYVLSVYQPNRDSILVRVHASAKMMGSTVSLIAHTGGELVFANSFRVDNMITSIRLPKKSFPTGIAQFTLFSSTGEPLNERIAFVRSKDIMQLGIKTAKSTYGSKERVQVELTARDGKSNPTAANFSVSVIDESKVPFDENKESTIFSNLLLTSDLKGHIEDPNYFFVSENSTVERALDDLMLTQGYRRFTWKQLNNPNNKPLFPAEDLGTVISGRVATLNDNPKPVAGANISMVALRANAVKSATTGADGRFSFEPFFLTDSIKFSLQARTAKGSDKVKLILDTIPGIKVNANPNLADASLNIHSSLKQFLENGKKQDDAFEKMGLLNKVHRLKEVKISAQQTKPKSDIAMQGILQVPEQSVDKIYKIPQPELCATVAICLQGALPRVEFVPRTISKGSIERFFPMYPMYREGADLTDLTIIVDGIKVDDPFKKGDMLEDGSIEATEIVKIEVVYANLALKSTLGGPAILIFTNRGMVKKVYNPSMANITPKGFNKVREFYAPRYDRPGRATGQPDLRTTIYWNPYLKTDANGTASFNFFNADGPGTYRVVIEGINADGQLGRQVFRYTVGDAHAITNTAIPASIDKNLALLTDPLDNFNKQLPVEKAYLQTDKPYYALGDTLWFKGYLTSGPAHQLSRLSEAVYVDLISEKDSLLQQLKLPVNSGMVIGNFILKDDYHQGSYRLRAYTQWMRNAGEDYFYDHTFLVGDVAGGEIIAKADFSYIPDKGKQVLTAILNYTNDRGKALGERDVRYEIWANHKPLWQQNGKTDALGSLRITIPDDIKQHPEGAYLHTILQGSDKYPVNRDFPVKATLAQSDIQFFPESGGLINGIASRVAFKAIGIDGLGIAIKGSIVDNDHHEVTKLTTLHAGMGSFLITPAPGKTYTANIVFEDGSTKSIALPKAADDGYVLSVDQSKKDSVLLRIYASAKQQHSEVNLIAHTGGEVVFASAVKTTGPVTSVSLQKKAFRSGIAQFTLFSTNGEPLNERIAFIRSNDMMQLDVKTTKADYNSKERVTIGLNAKDAWGNAAAGNFSVSVIDESKVPFNENKASTIFSSLLLKSDLKGFIEEPNYYFAQTGDETDKALDNLMLTQGYRRFAWKELKNADSTNPQFPAEHLKTTISGKVVTLNDKPQPVTGAVITMVALRAKITKTVNTGDDGSFRFEPLFLSDSIKFTLQARTDKGSDKVMLLLDSIPKATVNSNPNVADVSLNIHSSLQQYLDAGKKEDDTYEKLGMLDKVHRLKEVKIRAPKPDPLKNYAYQWSPMIPDGHADQVIYPKNLENAGLLGIGLQPLIGKIIFKSLKSPRGTEIAMYPHMPKFNRLIPMTIFLNGRKLRPDEAGAMFDGSQLDPSDVVRVDILDTNFYLYTKPENQKRIRYTPGVVNFTPKGYNKVREFYSPKYDAPNANLTLPDLRSTIYWNPDLKTGVNGNTSFSFFNADGPGTYKVTIEGINADGQLGRQVYRYAVSGMQSSSIK